MSLQELIKVKVLRAITADYAYRLKQDTTYTRTKHATWLGIGSSIYSRLSNGETEKILSDGEWIRIAQKLGVEMDGRTEWKTAPTAVYTLIFTQLDVCRAQSTTGIFCDDAGIGKTHAGKDYARKYVNVVYIDCSQCKTKHQLIRALVKEFGIDNRGRIVDVRERLVDGIRSMHKPLIILDEAGDLVYDAWLELKALYNAVEFYCGWYMMGAVGLEAKIERMRNAKKVGYDELYDRFGDAYQSMTKEVEAGGATMAILKRAQCEQVLDANLNVSKAERTEILKDCQNNLRRLRKEIMKRKNPLS